MENALSFTKFIETLGCHLRIGYYWSAASDDERRVVVTIWSDHLYESKYELLPKPAADPTNVPGWTKLPGANELRKHIPIAMRNGVEVLGVYCHALDPFASPRTRAYYDEKSLLVLNVEIVDGATIATVIGEVNVSQARLGKVVEYATPANSAMDDIDQFPIGTISPERMKIVATPFKRDQMVREFVLRRSKGRCELCGQEGFQMPNGQRYLEVHHIVSLACDGPDTVDNVVALCANHHREAHLGIEVDQLNARIFGLVKALK